MKKKIENFFLGHEYHTYDANVHANKTTHKKFKFTFGLCTYAHTQRHHTCQSSKGYA